VEKVGMLKGEVQGGCKPVWWMPETAKTKLSDAKAPQTTGGSLDGLCPMGNRTTGRKTTQGNQFSRLGQ